MESNDNAEAAPDDDLDALKAVSDKEAAKQAQLGQLFEKHRARLLRMVELRMDPALKARIGASDVLQEAFLEVAGRLDKYLDDPRMPFFVWVRFITAQRLLQLYRFHVGAQKRDARRERSALEGAGPAATAIALVDHLMASGIAPSAVVAEQEFRLQLFRALEGMDPLDREVLVLRHFEELSNAEAAQTLGIEKNTASQRHVRALKRLAKALREAGAAPGTLGGFPT